VGLLASAILHGASVMAVVLLPAAPLPAPLPIESIEVELIGPGEGAPTPSEPMEGAADRAAAREPPLPPSDDPGPATDTMVRATRLYSGTALADPRNRLAAAALGTLAPADRMEQLCGIEAMDQVHAWKNTFDPERLVAHAFAATTIDGNVMHAEGATFRSHGRWFALRFDCELSADHKSVVSFAFEVGDSVPTEEWEAHNLPALE
jgi:hypothetical protein